MFVSTPCVRCLPSKPSRLLGRTKLSLYFIVYRLQRGEENQSTAAPNVQTVYAILSLSLSRIHRRRSVFSWKQQTAYSKRHARDFSDFNALSIAFELLSRSHNNFLVAPKPSTLEVPISSFSFLSSKFKRRPKQSKERW